MVQVHVFISGRVQGVGFRYETFKQARGRGLKGWVRNLSDGRVEALFQGKKEHLDEMIAWLRRGPPRSRVDDVTVTSEIISSTLVNFTIE